jgi:hypothetical protein
MFVFLSLCLDQLYRILKVKITEFTSVRRLAHHHEKRRVAIR